jgi:hypothetical protein
MPKVNIPIEVSLYLAESKPEVVAYLWVGADDYVASKLSIKKLVDQAIEGFSLSDGTFQPGPDGRRSLTRLAKTFETEAARIRKLLADG